MKKTLLFLLSTYGYITNSVVLAQSEQHFRASIAVGSNFSQMAGDGQAGYHKIGAALGVKGAYCFKPNFDVSAELMYNSRGSRSNPFTSKATYLDKYVQLNAELNYADVALAANFHFLPSQNHTFYRQSLQIGVSYGRLLSSNISVLRGIFRDDFIEGDLQKTLRKDDIGFIIGYSWFFTQRLGLAVKHVVSVRNAYDNPLNGLTNRDYLSFTPYNLNLQVVFNFTSPNLNIKSHTEKLKKAKEQRKRNPLEDL
ncbi:MAG: porin family protein [Saprospiraceae bacterium]|nr:porin family protein [Saprospiraceae bacterium]